MNALDGVEDVAFGAAQGRKAKQGQVGLQLPDIMAAKSKIVGEISSAAAMRVVEGQRALEEGTLEFEHVRTKGGEVVRESLEQDSIQVSHGSTVSMVRRGSGERCDMRHGTSGVESGSATPRNSRSTSLSQRVLRGWGTSELRRRFFPEAASQLLTLAPAFPRLCLKLER